MDTPSHVHTHSAAGPLDLALLAAWSRHPLAHSRRKCGLRLVGGEGLRARVAILEISGDVVATA